METTLAYCSARDQKVRVAWTEDHAHEGHANLPDGPVLVCLDYGERCTGELCPMLGQKKILMAVRLARSGMREEGWPTFRGGCDACGRLTDLQVLDSSYVYCPECGSTGRWVHLQLDDGDYAALASTA